MGTKQDRLGKGEAVGRREARFRAYTSEGTAGGVKEVIRSKTSRPGCGLGGMGDDWGSGMA
jgi:hypothetical protein